MTPAHAWQQLNHESSRLGLPSQLSTVLISISGSTLTPLLLLLLSSCIGDLVAHTELTTWIVVEHRIRVFRPWSMAIYVHIRAMALLATLLLCLPRSSVCARAVGTTATTTGYNTIASPMSNYCATDFSQVSYTDVTAACPTSSNGASATCCAAFNAKACQYQAQVNDFGSLCPMMFISYLGAAGPYPAGYFVGPCGDGSKGFCIH